MQHIKSIYYHKFKISKAFLLLLAFYIFSKYFTYEKELNNQTFIELLKMNSFPEI